MLQPVLSKPGPVRFVAKLEPSEAAGLSPHDLAGWGGTGSYCFPDGPPQLHGARGGQHVRRRHQRRAPRPGRSHRRRL